MFTLPYSQSLATSVLYRSSDEENHLRKKRSVQRIFIATDKLDSFSRPLPDSPPRRVKKASFDIASILKPTMNTSYMDDTEDGSSDDPSSSFESEHSLNHSAATPSRGSNERIKSKRLRTIFTNEQLERLETEFERQQYMVGRERLYLARMLNLSETQVKVNDPLACEKQTRIRLQIWFQNRRIKWRRQALENQAQ